MSETSANGRAKVMTAVRAALLVRGDEPGRRGQVRTRLERTPGGVIPARARKSRAELIAAFQAMQEVQGSAVHRVAGADELPGAIAAHLAELNLPARLRHGSDPFLRGLPWQTSLIERDEGPAIASDAVCLSRAVGGVAETGTLFLTSGPENPTSLNFLPDTHCVTIAAEAIYGSFEEAWRALREAHGRRKLPRTVNLISGPSCSADIEQTIIRGAHGPRRLAIFIVDGVAQNLG